MASLNTRDAGQDFEGNGPSSFDPRDTYVFDASGEDLSDSRSAEKVAAVKAAEVQIERMMEAQRRDFAQAQKVAA